jgi:hypothetical protein
MFLKLSSQIEGQLREAYAEKHAAGVLNQSTLAKRLSVGRSVINRRLNGRINMTEESIADMVWAMDYDIDINIFDPSESSANHKPPMPEAAKASALGENKKDGADKKEKSSAAELAYAL